jgi:hypothetical protein
MHNDQISLIEVNKDTVSHLARTQGDALVSIYMPISLPGQNDGCNATTLKNLLKEVDKGLSESEEGSLHKWMQPLQAYVEDPSALIGAGASVAFFCDGEGIRRVDLPFVVVPSTHTGKHFQIKPLLKIAQADHSFLAVCLSRGHVAAFAGDSIDCNQVEIADLPKSIDETAEFDDPEKSLHQHTSGKISASGTTGSSHATQMHGHDGQADYQDSLEERFFRDTANALEAYLADKAHALVIIGSAHNVGQLTRNETFSERLVLIEHADPQGWKLEKIKEVSLEHLSKSGQSALEAKVENIMNQLGGDKAVSGVEKCALAAATGQLDAVVLGEDIHIFGTVDLENMQVQLAPECDESCAEDLLDYIATETLRYGGEVIALPEDQLPPEVEKVLAIARR